MKKFALLLLVMTLAGCAGTLPDKADLIVETANQSAKVYPASIEVSVVGRDKRTDPHVIVYKDDKEPALTLTSRLPLQMMVAESLAQGLREQGLNRGDRSNITVAVVVKEVQAKVTKPGALYSSKARTRLDVVVSNNGSVLTLEYNREASKESMTRPKVLFLETMLNDQLSDIVTKILEDSRLREAIKGK